MVILSLQTFEWVDLETNRAGFLTESQKESLSAFIDQQGTFLAWHVLAMGTYGMSFAATMWKIMDQRPVNPDSFMVMLLTFLLVGGVIVPYSTRQIRDLTRTLTLYRAGRVDSLIAECFVHALPKQPDHVLLLFGDQSFVLHADSSANLQSGKIYQIYYIGAALLSFEAA